MKTTLLLILLLVGWNVGAQTTDTTTQQQEGIIFMENQPWKSVLQKAKEQNRLIFMDCYTVWCGPCKGLSQDIFPQKKVGDFFNANFVNAKYDMEQGDGKMLYEKYKQHIIGFPTLLLIDADGNVVHQMAGYHEADDLIAGMKAGLEGKTLAAMEKKYNSGARDFETIRDYVAALNGAFQKETIQTVITDYLKTLPTEKLLEKDIWTLVGDYVVDPYSPAYQFVFNNIDKFQYRLDVDRYRLESQLGRGMDNAVDEIIKITTQTSNTDTLQLMTEKANQLRPMLHASTVKYFPTYFCKLQLNDLRLKGDAETANQMMTVAENLNILPYEVNFRCDIYLFIINSTKDKKILNTILERLLAQQAKEDKKETLLTKGNYNHVIAAAYTKLGQKDKATEAQQRYETLKTALEEEIKAWFTPKEDE